VNSRFFFVSTICIFLFTPAIVLAADSLNAITLQESNVISQQKPGFANYIVELREPPVAIKFKGDRSLRINRNMLNLNSEVVRAYKNGIQDDHQILLGQFSRILGRDVRAKHHLRVTLNAMVIELTAVEADRLRGRLPHIAILPDSRIGLTLNESAPLMQQGISAGQLDRDGNDCAVSGMPCLTGEGIIIAVIDSGVNYTHPDLGDCSREQFHAGNCEKVPFGRNYIEVDQPNDPNPVNPTFPVDHGTRVASAAAADGYLKGVAPGAKIYGYRVRGTDAFASMVTAAIEDALVDGAHILNMSVQGRGNPDTPLSRAMDNAVLAGVVVVVAADNTAPLPASISGPAAVARAITVGATYKAGFDEGLPVYDHEITDFSTRGPAIWTDSEGRHTGILKPDILAPGFKIEVASGSGEGSTVVSGTSFSTPLVSGAIAVLMQKHPDWTPTEIKSAIKNTAAPSFTSRASPMLGVNVEDDLNAFGAGRIDLRELVRINERPLIAELTDARFYYGVSKLDHQEIPIIGTAKGEGFDHFKILLSSENDDNWQQVCYSNQPRVEQELCTLNITNLEPGRYHLRLEVSDGGERIYKALNSIFIREIIEISSCQDLQDISQDVTAHYVLTGDIDCSESQFWNEGYGFIPLGHLSLPFIGKLDGSGYQLKNLYINRPQENRVGIFRRTTLFAAITDLNLVNIQVTGNSETGSLIGSMADGKVYRVSLSGTVSGGGAGVGGLVGKMEGGLISKSFSTSNVYSTHSNTGGLVGDSRRGSIYHSYATGVVQGNVAVGGLVGQSGHYSMIANSFAANPLSGALHVGGLIGRHFEMDEIPIFSENSFWDTEISGVLTSVGGTGKTTAEMMDINTFTNSNMSPGLERPWDFPEIWQISNGENYPAHTWSMPTCDGDLNGDGLVNAQDLSMLLSCWGSVSGAENWSECFMGDINGSGQINAQDLGILLSNWGAC